MRRGVWKEEIRGGIKRWCEEGRGIGNSKGVVFGEGRKGMDGEGGVVRR